MRLFLLAVSCVLALWSGAGAARAQTPLGSPPTRYVPEQQPAKFLLYNLLLGAGIGGAGAALNGTDGTPWERFWRGAGRGAVGGALLYEGKRLTHLIVQEGQPAYGLLAVGVHELGGSVVENASYDRPLLDRLYLHTGFLRWEWRPGAGAQVRVMPYALNSTLYLLREGYRLDVGHTLATATPVFVGGDKEESLLEQGFIRAGFAGPGVIGLTNPSFYAQLRESGHVRRVLAHELVHSLQHRELIRTNALASPALRLIDGAAWYERMERVIYVDSPVVMRTLYWLVDSPPECHYTNWFEREAEVLAENRPVSICR